MDNSSMTYPAQLNMSMNNTGDFEENFAGPLDHLATKVIFIVLYSIVFLLAFVGNLLIIIVVLKHRRMRTITNFFLANLAVADLAVGIFCVMPQLSVFLNSNWIFGNVMCKLYYFIQAMSYTASVTILTVISIERYIAIIYPLRAKQLTTMCLLRVTIVAIWVISAVSSLPYLFMYTEVSLPGFALRYCLPNPLHHFNPKIYVTVNFVLWYLFPMSLMVVMYSKISVVLWRTSSEAVRASKKAGPKPASSSSGEYSVARQTGNKDKHGSAEDVSKQGEEERLMNNPKQQKRSALSSCTKDSCFETIADGDEDCLPISHPARTDKELAAHIVSVNNVNKIQVNGLPGRKSPMIRVKARFTVQRERKQECALLARRRVIRLLVAVIASFAGCVLPYHIRILWNTWVPMVNINSWTSLLGPISFVIFYLNCGLNPILYAFLSERFRVSLIEIVSCRDSRKQRQTSFSLKTINSTL